MRRLTRRQLIAAAPWIAAAQSPPARPKIAAICTTYFPYSHSQHIVDRFLMGYGWNGAHHRPAMDVVSLWVDQIGKDDLSRGRLQEFPSMKGFPSIAEALTLGTDKLAVDAVLLIGEHGRYGRNEKGQHLYPRYEFFREIVKVFESSGRAVPMFNDKHLSWNWDWSLEMVETSRRLRFPFMAGSSLPVTWRTPQVEMPYGAKIREALCVGYGGVDSYDFHALETVQCMVERRKGGESGVKWLEAYRGDAMWKALAEGAWSRQLMDAALCRSHTLTPSRAGFNNDFPSVDDMKRIVKNPVAYVWEHNDGVKGAIVLLNGLVQDFNFASFIDGRREPFSTQMYLPMPPARTTLASFFTPLSNNIEQMFATGKPAYPVERTLLTSGLTTAGVESLYQGKRVETPHLARVAYTAPRQSTFWRT
ncbi:MAG: hypothetical protein R2762_01590 [Bryobacteraceae bacterium]